MPLRLIPLLLLLLTARPGLSAAQTLVFSVKTWEGEYASRDVPGGVESTPSKGSIFIIDADGTGLKEVIPSETGADYPTLSPDGKWIYFQSRTSGAGQVYRSTIDGRERQTITDPKVLAKQLNFPVKDGYGYALSSDGSQMLFSVHDGSSGRVVLAKADGMEPRIIAPHLGYIYMARLSPKNDRVVFSGPAKGYRLVTATLPDGKPQVLTPDHPESFVPQFTPDGRTIIFTRRDGDIYRVDIDGTKLQRLTEGNRYVEFRLSAKDSHGSTDGPDISPDGKQIAFIALHDKIPNVHVMDLDGKNRRRLTNRLSACGRVKWSPDGKSLSFISFEGKYPQLFVIPLSGGEPHQLSKLNGGVNFVNWGNGR